ncbi:hypothetical protein [Aerococcus urinaehominis]|uniref:hypothetical protein n=1 Tax=Aerococcus urinaehominis TaxID=128944 RepID=UPI000AA86E27|nr:hypothetical protein [Aerococcus urinaehominis]
MYQQGNLIRGFDSETLILGILSDLIGLGVAYAATLPISLIIEHPTGLVAIAKLNPGTA